MFTYKVSNDAEYDLERIYWYGVKIFGVDQAEKYYMGFFNYFESIASNPYAFQEIHFLSRKCRLCVYGSNSIYYQLNNSVVEILAIIGSQDIDGIL